MKPADAFDWIAIVLIVIGGLNWALVGAFDFNLVAVIFGEATMLIRIVYVLIGVAAIYVIYGLYKAK